MHANLVGEQRHTTSTESTVTFRAPFALAVQPSTSRASSVTSESETVEVCETESECESEKSFSSTGDSSLKKTPHHHQPTLSSSFQKNFCICRDWC